MASSQVVASSWAWILKATGGKLFLAGRLVRHRHPGLRPDATRASRLYQGTVRTEGWVEDVVVSGNTAYLPSGDYGTKTMRSMPEEKPTAHTEVTLEVTHSDAAGLDQSIVYVPTKYTYRLSTFKLGLAADTAWGLISLQAYTNKNQQGVSVPFTGLADAENFNEVSVVQANDLLKIGADHALRIGLEYRSNREWAPVNFSGSSDYQDYASSIMWNWQDHAATRFDQCRQGGPAGGASRRPADGRRPVHAGGLREGAVHRSEFQ